MLSILIPTYNYVCVHLVRDLHRQAEHLCVSHEILVADDASQEEYKNENRKINDIPYCRYIELPENVGRARIRNLLGQSAQYEYLLFMDCDAAVVDEDYLARYIESREKSPVVYGGLVHPDTLPSPEQVLAYRYEKQAERRFSLKKRQENPYRSFRTFNFMVRRDVFLQNPFDESIRNYGHEDTLFGKVLQEKCIPILHIENPLMNCGLDDGQNLIRKTEISLQTLYDLRDKMGDCSAVLHLYRYLHRLHLVGLTAFVYRKSRSFLFRNLTEKKPFLTFFTFYKIGYYCNYSIGKNTK